MCAHRLTRSPVLMRASSCPLSLLATYVLSCRFSNSLSHTFLIASFRNFFFLSFHRLLQHPELSLCILLFNLYFFLLIFILSFLFTSPYLPFTFFFILYGYLFFFHSLSLIFYHLSLSFFTPSLFLYTLSLFTPSLSHSLHLLIFYSFSFFTLSHSLQSCIFLSLSLLFFTALDFSLTLSFIYYPLLPSAYLSFLLLNFCLLFNPLSPMFRSFSFTLSHPQPWDRVLVIKVEEFLGTVFWI